MDDSARKGTDMTILAILPQSGFGHLARGLSDHIRASPPLDPQRPVLMPGDRELAERRAATSIRVDRPTWDALASNAARAGLQMPRALEAQ